MPAATADPLVDVLSEINETTGSNYLDTCSLVVGDGTVRVDFKNGRASVPASVARQLRHPHVKVLGLPDATEDTPDVEPEPEPVEAAKRPERRGDATAEEIEAAKQYLREQGIAVPDEDAEEPASDPETPEAEADPEAESTEADSAPEAPVVPAGWEATTPENQPRCQAAKADGTQCSNAAVDGNACGLKQHKDKLQA